MRIVLLPFAVIYCSIAVKSPVGRRAIAGAAGLAAVVFVSGPLRVKGIAIVGWENFAQMVFVDQLAVRGIKTVRWSTPVRGTAA